MKQQVVVTLFCVTCLYLPRGLAADEKALLIAKINPYTRPPALIPQAKMVAPVSTRKLTLGEEKMRTEKPTPNTTSVSHLSYEVPLVRETKQVGLRGWLDRRLEKIDVIDEQDSTGRRGNTDVLFYPSPVESGNLGWTPVYFIQSVYPIGVLGPGKEGTRLAVGLTFNW